MAPAANLFDLEADILAALETLKAEQPRLSVGAAITLVGTANIARLLPGVFVQPGAPASIQDAGETVEQRELWHVTCAVQAIPNKETLAATHTALGELGAAVVLAVRQGVPGLSYRGHDEVVYMPGHVELGLRFEIDTVLDLDSPAGLSDFERFYADWDLAAPDGEDEARDHIELPTGDTP